MNIFMRQTTCRSELARDAAAVAPEMRRMYRPIASKLTPTGLGSASDFFAGDRT
jgi:hypothetical protein